MEIYTILHTKGFVHDSEVLVHKPGVTQRSAGKYAIPLHKSCILCNPSNVSKCLC